MKNKKIIFCIFLLIFCLILSGCSSIFLSKNTTITDKDETQTTAEIQNLIALGTGSLQDASTNGDRLLVFSTSKAPPTTYNIELYRHQGSEWSVINFVSSDKPHVSGVFSSDGLGIFYTETSDTDDHQKKIRQLMWTSLDKTTTLTLSDEDENVVTALCQMPDGKVLYANDHHQICILNANNWRKNYTIDPDYTIEKLSYDPINERIIFSGTYKDDPTVNLYVTSQNQEKIDPVLFDIDIITYDLNSTTGNFIYLKRNASENQLILYNSSNGQTKQIGHANITNAVLRNDGNAVIYTVPTSISDTQHQTIERMSIDGKNIRQVTSPRILVSKLFFIGNKIYFSVMDEEADVDSDNYDSTIYALTIKESEE